MIVCVYGYDVNLIVGYVVDKVVMIFGLDVKCYVLVMVIVFGKVVSELIMIMCYVGM